MKIKGVNFAGIRTHLLVAQRDVYRLFALSRRATICSNPFNRSLALMITDSDK